MGENQIPGADDYLLVGINSMIYPVINEFHARCMEIVTGLVIFEQNPCNGGLGKNL
jgi:hypothetical protein